MRIPKPTLLLTPNGSHDRNGPVTPSITGGVLTVPGQYGPAWRVSEGTKNFVQNPAGRNDTAGWATGANRSLDAGAIIPEGAPVSTGFRHAATAALTGTATAAASVVTVDGAGPLTLSWHVYIPNSWTGGTIGAQLYNFADAAGAVAAADMSKRDEWQRIIVPTVTIDGTDLNGAVQVLVANWEAGEEFYSTAIQLEPKAYATPYADGTRQYGTIHLDDNPVQDRPAYEVLLRGRFLYRGITGTVLGDASHRLRYDQSGAVSLWDGASRGGAYQIAPGDAGVVGISFDGTDTTIIVNGQKERIAGLDYRSGGQFAVGYTGGDYVANMLVEGVIAFDRPLTDAEREYLVTMPRAWTWGELAEPVRISSTVRGDGAYAVSTRLYRADRYGTRLERIPVDMPITGTIQYNEDTNPKHALSLEVNRPGALRPFHDYIVPELTLTDASGNRRTEAFGLYVVTPPKTTLSSGRYTGTIEGKSILWLLAKDSLTDGLVIDPGVDFGAAARDIVRGAGFTDAQISIPDTGVTSAEETTFDPGTTRLEAANKLLDSANHYTLWADTQTGTIRTVPRHDYDSAGATHRYGPEHDLTPLGKVSETPEWGRLRNRVTVRNIAPEREPVYWTAEVENPDSPLHPDNLGYILADPPIDDPQIETEEQARARAEALLSEGASYYRKVNVRTVLDLDAGAHDLVELSLAHAGARYDGLWIRRTWTVRLGQVSGYTDSELYRVERWRA